MMKGNWLKMVMGAALACLALAMPRTGYAQFLDGAMLDLSNVEQTGGLLLSYSYVVGSPLSPGTVAINANMYNNNPSGSGNDAITLTGSAYKFPSLGGGSDISPYYSSNSSWVGTVLPADSGNTPTPIKLGDLNLTALLAAANGSGPGTYDYTADIEVDGDSINNQGQSWNPGGGAGIGSLDVHVDVKPLGGGVVPVPAAPVVALIGGAVYGLTFFRRRSAS